MLRRFALILLRTTRLTELERVLLWVAVNSCDASGAFGLSAVLAERVGFNFLLVEVLSFRGFEALLLSALQPIANLSEKRLGLSRDEESPTAFKLETIQWEYMDYNHDTYDTSFSSITSASASYMWQAFTRTSRVERPGEPGVVDSQYVPQDGLAAGRKCQAWSPRLRVLGTRNLRVPGWSKSPKSPIEWNSGCVPLHWRSPIHRFFQNLLAATLCCWHVVNQTIKSSMCDGWSVFLCVPLVQKDQTTSRAQDAPARLAGEICARSILAEIDRDSKDRLLWASQTWPAFGKIAGYYDFSTAFYDLRNSQNILCQIIWLLRFEQYSQPLRGSQPPAPNPSRKTRGSSLSSDLFLSEQKSPMFCICAWEASWHRPKKVSNFLSCPEPNVARPHILQQVSKKRAPTTIYDKCQRSGSWASSCFSGLFMFGHLHDHLMAID